MIRRLSLGKALIRGHKREREKELYLLDGSISKRHASLLKLCEMVFLFEINNMCWLVGAVYGVLYPIIHIWKS